MKRTFNIILALLLLSPLSGELEGSAFAQSAQWSLAPVYKAIDQLSPTLYRISSAKKVGVATADGAIIVDTIADAVTEIPNGYVISNNKGKKKSDILAIIDQNGTSIMTDEAVAEVINLFKSKKKDKSVNSKSSNSKFEVDGPQTFTEKKLVGYKSGEKTVLPPQFISAQPFVGGYAIAENETGCGILKLIPQSFTCKQTNAVLDAGMENTTHTSSLAANPDATLKIKCVDSTGMTFENEGVKKGNSVLYELSTFKERRTFTIIANDDKGSLVLWNSNFSNEDANDAKAKTNTKGKTKTKAKTTKKKKR